MSERSMLLGALRDAAAGFATIANHVEHPAIKALAISNMRNAKAIIHLAQPSCDVGIFGDHSQMDLQDRADLKP